ncbi:tail fiber domain-containing protein [Citrobacter portucalensis]|uniref:tail fiber domain-containing protein n=1 Tax=Citrobacter portucalensis TaxID=1639133 RepID=UPI00226B1DE0|nr:tail fiber domain-containing protein [Citrobacter portucalensis]MCX9055218.1 tail fiber domain-containing protein [Citrobacter portucalensis]
MTKYATKNPLGSTSPYDLFDNAQNFDIAVNSITAAIWKDRFGNDRKTYWGMEQQFSAQLLGQEQRFNLFIQNSGYQVIGDYVDGPLTITEYNQLIRYGDELWKLTSATELPYTTAGNTDETWAATDAEHFTSVGDAALRQNLASDQDDLGDSLVTVKQPFTAAVPRTQHDKNAEFITPADFGAFGDGVTLDDSAFAKIESELHGRYIDLNGLTYSVTTAFIGNKYGNGFFKRADGEIVPAIYHPAELRAGRYIVAVGQEALANVPELPVGSLATNLIAIGRRAMYSAVNVRNNYAIGYQALYSMQNGIYNTAFGFESLFSNNGTGDGTTGSRNAAFGDNTLRFNTTGYNNLAFGRNAGQTNETGNSNIHIGVASGAGDCPVDLNKNIINTFPTNKNHCVAVGTSTLFYTDSDGHTAIGDSSLQYLKRGLNNTAVGFLAGRNLESDVGPTGKVMITATTTGTYSASDGVVIVTQAAHGYGDGDTVKIRFTSGPLSTVTTDYLWLQISVTGANTYTFSAPASLSGTGSTQVTARFTTVDSTVQCDFNTAVGYSALSLGTKARASTAIGAGALTTGGLSDNTAVGFRALALLAEDNNQIRNTALGSRALELMQDGTNCTTIFNSTGVGYQAYVSGSSQVQIGNSATTTYVYGTVQNRSDERDKTDIRDTKLGIDFILGLRPVDGRWDMRDDYIEFYPDAPEKPEAPVEPEAPPPPSEEQIPNLSTESDAGLYGQDPENIRIYHLDGDPTNPYSRVIETGESGISDDHQGEYPEDDYPRLLAIYLQERAAYESNMAQYQADLITYKNDCALWEAECERIKEHNARVATGELRDGSKKRERFHHWFIAQEVKELCDKLGVDFGGYQDHSVDGGCDVLSLGYDEFIPPTVRAVQQCWERMDALEARLAKLESQ